MRGDGHVKDEAQMLKSSRMCKTIETYDVMESRAISNGTEDNVHCSTIQYDWFAIAKSIGCQSNNLCASIKLFRAQAFYTVGAGQNLYMQPRTTRTRPSQWYNLRPKGRSTINIYWVPYAWWQLTWQSNEHMTTEICCCHQKGMRQRNNFNVK